jgi:hypothetical protein
MNRVERKKECFSGAESASGQMPGQEVVQSDAGRCRLWRSSLRIKGLWPKRFVIAGLSMIGRRRKWDPSSVSGMLFQ